MRAAISAAISDAEQPGQRLLHRLLADEPVAGEQHAPTPTAAMIAVRSDAVTLTMTNTAVGIAVMSAPDQPPMLASICWR